MPATIRRSRLGSLRLPAYSLGEEIAHSVSHGVGIVLSITGLAVLVAIATLHGSARHVVTSAIFGVSLILAYVASTLYHAIPLPRAKRVLRILDHASIYLLIAGTYTPFTLLVLPRPWSWGLFVGIWVAAVGGILFKVFALGRAPILSALFYLAMGWSVVVAFEPLVTHLAPGGLKLVIAGGLCYTVGLLFFAWQRLPYHHFVWHLWVLAGSTLHFFAVLLYVLPRGG